MDKEFKWKLFDVKTKNIFSCVARLGFIMKNVRHYSR